ncbi:peptide-methionine (R)-S-oxide reductase MsrB [Patescibacteria group bacterium]|nr:peptide-methionine (R)-S-oxide reductase MsrB [Patescibacteria group bacterium]
MRKTDEELRTELTPEQYHVLREKGTEAAFTGEYWNEHSKGMYQCAACGAQLFSSETKFDSGTGWPSFDQAIPGAVEFKQDLTHGMSRTEVTCAACGSHLGHMFEDGPATTGKRFCINSCALNLKKES